MHSDAVALAYGAPAWNPPVLTQTEQQMEKLHLPHLFSLSRPRLPKSSPSSHAPATLTPATPPPGTYQRRAELPAAPGPGVLALGLAQPRCGREQRCWLGLAAASTVHGDAAASELLSWGAARRWQLLQGRRERPPGPAPSAERAPAPHTLRGVHLPYSPGRRGTGGQAQRRLFVGCPART